MPECLNNVGRGVVVYPCLIERGHDGPCAARENIPSWRARQTWEQGQSAAEEILGVAPPPIVVPTEAPDDVASVGSNPRIVATAHGTVEPPADHVPTLYELGMQGPPQTSQEGLVKRDDPTKPNSPRLHPAEVRRLAHEPQGESIETRLVQTAGAVDISGVQANDESVDDTSWPDDTPEVRGRHIATEEPAYSEDLNPSEALIFLQDVNRQFRKDAIAALDRIQKNFLNIYLSEGLTEECDELFALVREALADG